MNFNSFIDFLNCLYIEEVEIAARTNNQERLARMVFTGDFGNDITNTEVDDSSRRQAMRTARCVKILGKGVVKVVHRCDDAKENENLDLSECQLMQVPDAVFLLMKNTTLHSCSLAGNLITKIPPKLAMSFSLITELNLARNRISSLPNEMSNCTQLESIDISANSFVQLPPVLAEIPSLNKVNASKNFIADVEIEAMLSLGNLEHVNLEENPINKPVYEELAKITSIRVVLSPREQEDWEDLSI